MKTPQEEAKEMAAKSASFYHTFGMTVRDSIKESIPLAELIAVARAAKNLSSENLVEDLTTLEEAVQALRATGKVEL